ncbi:hypothetical protein DEJ50_27165 [Streptomyces venezuelae]|uniref:Uncharacterized protein n=1 Tax=Streptomyces venezuelae TaxID=54571 RepID=A0A5P2DA62_STRVZ|nr:hypothetical protein [Streptomyces venezuelae]QES50968.1 hypothetical protein DEJ50_27165 [Streptomyces venezuelae]
MPRHACRRSFAVLTTPALALSLLAIAPAGASERATAQTPTSTAESVMAPTVCHGLSKPPQDQYHKGCRQGYLEGSKVGNRDGRPPICNKTLPPLSPVNPSAFERGKSQGYRYGYDQAYAKAYRQYCASQPKPQQPPPPPPPAQQQTPESMAAAGKAAGESWGRADAEKCDLNRPNARLKPSTNTLILAYQNAYAVAYDTTYDEVFRQKCLNR